jgi:hypothetical protein
VKQEDERPGPDSGNAGCKDAVADQGWTAARVRGVRLRVAAG